DPRSVPTTHRSENRSSLVSPARSPRGPITGVLIGAAIAVSATALWFSLRANRGGDTPRDAVRPAIVTSGRASEARAVIPAGSAVELPPVAAVIASPATSQTTASSAQDAIVAPATTR